MREGPKWLLSGALLASLVYGSNKLYNEGLSGIRKSVAGAIAGESGSDDGTNEDYSTGGPNTIPDTTSDGRNGRNRVRGGRVDDTNGESNGGTREQPKRVNDSVSEFDPSSYFNASVQIKIRRNNQPDADRMCAAHIGSGFIDLDIVRACSVSF